MATPETNAVDRSLAVMANILNREVSIPSDGDFVLRIIDAFMECYDKEVKEIFGDTTSLTNAQKAVFFLKKMKDLPREEVLRKSAERNAKRNMIQGAKAAGNLAARDLA